MEKEEYTEEQAREAIAEAIDTRLENEGFDFDSVSRNEENDLTAAMDNIAEESLENMVKVEEGNEFIELNTDIKEWAEEQVSEADLSEVIEGGFEEKYDISDSVKENENWAEEIKNFEISENETLNNGFEADKFEGFEFNETLAAVDNLDNDIKDSIMTREEGIEAALEAGVDIKDLAEITSNEEVVEAAKEAANLEVLDGHGLELESFQSIESKLNEDAKEFDIEINLDNLDLAEEMSFQRDTIDIDDRINDLNLEGVEAFQLNDSEGAFSSQEVIIDTDKISKEELTEAVADSIYEENKENFQEQVNNGETFEETHDNKVELEQGKSEISVEGDHATIKEDTMSGEESERVVDRETALNEMDREAGVDSDKVETKEEHSERDNLSVEEKEAKLVEIAETTTDKEVLDRLADTDSDKVQEAVANNENTSEETREKIESKEETQEQSQGMSH